MEEADVREQLRVVIKESAAELWSPWYVPGHVPDDVAELFADVALRRWQSRNRRALGRRDPVRDLAKGFSQSRAIHPETDPIFYSDRDDYQALAAALVDVLRRV